MKNIRVNGKTHSTNCDSVHDLAAELDPTPQCLVVELNGRALLRSEWKTSPLHEGDNIEILRISAGG